MLGVILGLFETHAVINSDMSKESTENVLIVIKNDELLNHYNFF